MNYDHCTVFARKVYLHMIDLYNTDFTAAKRFPSYGHFLALFIFHADIYGIRVNICFQFIRGKRKLQPFFMRNVKRISDAHVICGKSHDTAKQSTVSTVTTVSFCKGAVQDKVSPL